MCLLLRVANPHVSLLDFVFGQVAIRFREFLQFRLVVDVWFGDFEAAYTVLDIRLDVGDTVDFRQIASDRGGTGTSRHVGNFERHQCVLGRS